MKTIPHINKRTIHPRKNKLIQRKALTDEIDDQQSFSMTPPLMALASAWVSYRNYQNSHENRVLKLKHFADEEKDLI